MGNYKIIDPKMTKALTRENAKAMLPKIGDRMQKTPTTLNDKFVKPKPAWCKVVYVNAAHLWYTVQFQGNGVRFRESYKVPEKKGE